MQKFIRIFSIFSFSHFLVLSFAQNVGIGILAPLGKLHVKGAADVSQLIIDANSTQGNLNPLIRFRKSDGTDLMWIHSNHPSNVFFGINTGRVVTTGYSNTFIGSDAGSSNTTGSINTAIGNYALRYNVAGSGATAIGNFAMANANDAATPFTNNSVAVGYEALRGSATPADNTGTFNTALGYQALRSNTSGSGNTVGGYQSLSLNTTGANNTASGYQSLYFNTTGANNTASGHEVLRSNTIGSYNTAIGVSALKNNIAGNSNTANGYKTLWNNTTGNFNIANGHYALYQNTSASQNTAIGGSALYSQSYNPGSVWNSNNVAVGTAALYANQPISTSTGILNTAVGNYALNTNITGSKNTALGTSADVISDNLINATAIGYNAKVAASNSLVLGGTGTDAVNVGIGTTNPNAKLEVVGTLKVVDGTQGAGKILTSNATGLASWQPPPPPPGTNDPSVSICCQRWMTKNLDVATYRNGDAIPKVTDAAAWAALTTGAYCYYNNDSTTYAATYGKLYNWYAVNDSRGLAPEGWYIPTDFEWTTLSNCLGGVAVAGGPMKETGTTHWTTPNAGATNLSGFKGLPGGARSYDGTFYFIGNDGYWWSSSENTTNFAWNRKLFYNDDDLFRLDYLKLLGLSVRCLRD